MSLLTGNPARPAANAGQGAGFALLKRLCCFSLGAQAIILPLRAAFAFFAALIPEIRHGLLQMRAKVPALRR
ncbi:MAG: hypothetical protein DU429_08125 [Candidatus Tokpelaia sp.]|nr:MAG: hypothetical protein DU430_08445 [Candidatus Tokpelaia sp.]KAA6205405.1 MAG: hypothetical protein DU429_08125 [Candidatus Tokpelaia sp.]